MIVCTCIRASISLNLKLRKVLYYQYGIAIHDQLYLLYSHNTNTILTIVFCLCTQIPALSKAGSILLS